MIRGWSLAPELSCGAKPLACRRRYSVTRPTEVPELNILMFSFLLDYR
ncbi:MAG: hypothetical protein WD766_07515 [Gemmatimonadota bacterium]